MTKRNGDLTKSQRKSIRKKLYLEDQCCFWCGGVMLLHPEPDEVEEMATIEHLKPLSIGGPNELWNLVLVHKRCNK